MPAPRCSCFCCLSAVAPARVGRHASFVWHVGAWQHKCVCAAVATRHGDGTCAPAPTGTRLTRDHARAIHALDSPPGEAHRQSTCSHTRAPYCICSDVQHQPARIERDDRERDEPEDDHRKKEQQARWHSVSAACHAQTACSAAASTSFTSCTARLHSLPTLTAPHRSVHRHALLRKSSDETFALWRKRRQLIPFRRCARSCLRL